MIGPFKFALFFSAACFNLAALHLVQHADPEKVQHCNEFCQHQLRRGEAVSIVLKRHGLSAAFDDCNTDIIISMATPLYPCRTAKTIYYFTQNMMTIICYIDIKKVSTMFLIIPDQAS